MWRHHTAHSALHLCKTAIHEQFRSRDIAAVVGCEKYHGLRDLIGSAESAKGNMLEIIFKRCWPVSVEASRSFNPGFQWHGDFGRTKFAGKRETVRCFRPARDCS